MSSVLDKARRHLEHAEAEARKTAAAHREALTKLREAEKQVQRLEFSALEAQMHLDAVTQRTARDAQ